MYITDLIILMAILLIVHVIYSMLFLQLSEDAARKENELNELEEEIERLRNRLQQPTENYRDEVTKLSAITKFFKPELFTFFALVPAEVTLGLID